jgi:hypothetical protein
MKKEFDFGYHKHDFSPIYETIKKYLPLNNPEYNHENLREFPGTIEVNELLNKNFFNQKKYRSTWMTFRKFLKKELKKPVEETMIAFYPCYSGIVVLNKAKKGAYTFRKELHFYISLLGPYYSIFGVDASYVSLEEYPIHMFRTEQLRNRGPFHRDYRAFHALTVAPYMEFKEPFILLQKKIIEYFPHLHFVPFQINLTDIPGLFDLFPDARMNSNFSEKLKDSVFNALFRPEKYLETETRGDSRYGFDEWLKPIDDEGLKRTKEIIIKNSLLNQNELTIHKVWTLNTITPIPRKKGSPSIFFGMDPIKILDLTSTESALLISKDDEDFTTTPYEIINNEIHFISFKNLARLKISALSVNELKLVLSLNTKTDDGKEINTDIVEMEFELYSE